MPSGEDIPYQLRPNKYIDRELFLELAGRLIPVIGTEKFCYISMGGKHLVDHKQVYKRLGIDALYAFDADHEIVARQLCNRPTDLAKCETKLAGDVVSSLDEVLAEFDGKTNAIVWLDFTQAYSRGNQLEEFAQLAKRVTAGDLIRITMNANIENLASPGDWQTERAGRAARIEQAEQAEVLEQDELNDPNVKYGTFARQRLSDQIGDLLPTSVDKVDGGSFADVLFQSIELALSNATKAIHDRSFWPVLLTKYRDGQTMITATYICLAAKEELPDAIKNWNFLHANGNPPVSIKAPDLSIKEKCALDDVFSQPSDKIVDEVGFLSLVDKEESVKAVDSYKALHRYYPAFQNIDIS